MKIKSVVLEKEFIPEFNGNKELPKGEQIVVEIKKHISNLNMARYKKFINKMDGSMSIEYDDSKILGLHVGDIKNLEEDNGTKIKNGVDLADSTNKNLYDLMVEIRRYLLDAGETLTEGEK